MFNNGNNNHPFFGGIGPNTKVHPKSVLVGLTWLGGLAFAAIPGAFAIGTAVEYLNKTSDVPGIVPFICLSISVGVILGTKKVAENVNPKVVTDRKKKRKNGLAM